MVDYTRRQALKRITTAAIFAPTVFQSRAASAALPPLPQLPPAEALLLQPGDQLFSYFQPAFNARTMLTPQLRALCKTPNSVSTVLDWCRSNKLSFSLRSGGHCFEGLSQSRDVVIDTRMMNDVSVDVADRVVTVGAGASLGQIYKQIAAFGLAFAGGSCPTVGISGHVLGGGYGLLARQFGLACDNLLSLDLISASGREVRADPHINPELFWASRGGGGGSFGAVTSFRLQLYRLTKVLAFRMDWDVTVDEGVRIMKDWQAWAPQAPRSITALLVMSQHPKGVSISCLGQSTGSISELRRELKTLSTSPKIQFTDYFSAVNQEAGTGGWKHLSQPMKGKSDYIKEPMSDDGIRTLMAQLSRTANILVVCDPYGGAIADVASKDSAFAHRAGTLFCIQYSTDWSDPKEENEHLLNIRNLYAAMRPYVSGSAYVNYCDLDLGDWPQAYWGENLQRLKQIKASWDPDNVFHHSQSVPVG